MSAVSYEALKARFEGVDADQAGLRFRTTCGGRRTFHRALGDGLLVSESKAAFTVANQDWMPLGGAWSSMRFLCAWFKDENARSYEYIEHGFVKLESRLRTVYYAFPEPRHVALVAPLAPLAPLAEEKQANVDFFLDYILLLVEDNPAHVEWMVMWLADILVNPHDKGPRPIAVVLWGAHESGKSSLCELMSRLLGARLVHRTGFFLPSDLRWRSNDVLKYKLFVEFEDIDFRACGSGRKSNKTARRISAMIAERGRTISPRFTDATHVKASERVLITTSMGCKMVIESDGTKSGSGAAAALFAAFAVSSRRVGDNAYWDEHYQKLGSARAGLGRDRREEADSAPSYIRDVAEYLLSRAQWLPPALGDTRPVTDYYRSLVLTRATSAL
jgi:hypothetical protein